MRAAAAITSITMNGGTSLRPDGEISRLADSSMVWNLKMWARNPLPRCCRIRPLRCRLRGTAKSPSAGYQLAEFGAMAAVMGTIIGIIGVTSA
jgi:hypothetical protein